MSVHNANERNAGRLAVLSLDQEVLVPSKDNEAKCAGPIEYHVIVGSIVTVILRTKIVYSSGSKPERDCSGYVLIHVEPDGH